MERIKKNFGFGFMRLPIRDGEVDIAETNRMVDAFLDAGFNYFDTAHGYLQGKSEKTLKTCLTTVSYTHLSVSTKRPLMRTFSRSPRSSGAR